MASTGLFAKENFTAWPQKFSELAPKGVVWFGSQAGRVNPRFGHLIVEAALVNSRFGRILLCGTWLRVLPAELPPYPRRIGFFVAEMALRSCAGHIDGGCRGRRTNAWTGRDMRQPAYGRLGKMPGRIRFANFSGHGSPLLPRCAHNLLHSGSSESTACRRDDQRRKNLCLQ